LVETKYKRITAIEYAAGLISKVLALKPLEGIEVPQEATLHKFNNN